MGISGFPGRSPGWGQFRALGAASLECCAVAEGVLDAYLVVGGSTLYVWDYLAALLICREAGAAEGERDGNDLVVAGRHTTSPGGGRHDCTGRALERGEDTVSVTDDREAALLARKTWRTLEPLHGAIYFAPEAAEAYARLGITGSAGYFASRAAPMGAVPADVVVSTFFNFNPELVQAAIPESWNLAAPVELVAARFEAVDASWRRALGEPVLRSAEMARASELARAAAEHVTQRLEGRPLAAAHCDVAWPDAPHLVLWHAQSILREYRGDGHIAQLVVHGLSGTEALVTHAAAGDVPARVLKATRGWPDEAWDRRSTRCAGEAGWSRGRSCASARRVRASARRSRTGPTCWRPHRTWLWATRRAPSSGRWLGPGARSWPTCCADPSDPARPTTPQPFQGLSGG